MFKKSIYYIFFSLVITLNSCNLFNTKEVNDAVARVGDDYLTQSDIRKIVGENITKEDSINIVNNYINNWATKKLLEEKAKINLPDNKALEFEDLIEQYRADLYITAYKEALVGKSMDTTVTNQEMKLYYNDNKDNFKLNEELVKLRYISISKDYNKLEDLKQRFQRFNKKDREDIESQSLKFKFYSLNDTVWVKASEIIQKIPIINTENKDSYLKKSQFFELTDSLGVYLVAVNDVLNRNETAPLTYVEPTLKQIILNKRKLEFIKKLETDLLNEAFKKKQFEIYE